MQNAPQVSGFIAKPDIFNIDNHVRDYQIMIRNGELGNQNKSQMIAFTTGWAMSRGFPLDKAIEFTDYVYELANFFLTEGEVNYQIGIEGGDRWANEVAGALAQVTIYHSIEEVITECEEFLKDAKESGMDYEENDLQIFEFVNGVEVREMSFGEALDYPDRKQGNYGLVLPLPPR